MLLSIVPGYSAGSLALQMRPEQLPVLWNILETKSESTVENAAGAINDNGVLSRDVPLAKNFSTGTAQQRLF